jgi:hypothetical protein
MSKSISFQFILGLDQRRVSVSDTRHREALANFYLVIMKLLLLAESLIMFMKRGRKFSFVCGNKFIDFYKRCFLTSEPCEVLNKVVQDGQKIIFTTRKNCEA